ncbi:hypothetical protein ACFX2C_021102 [Malus domestica]
MENPRFSEMKRCFLGTFGIIESAMKIPFRNPNFIILTSITSFPLFSLTLLQKLPVDYQPSLIYEAIDLLRSLSDHAMTLNYWHYARPLVPSCCPPRHFRLVQSGCPTRHSRLSGLAMHWIVYGVAIAKWLEHSVRWNLSVVVSILEEKRGLFEAITASSELSKGKMLRGWLFFMLLFSVGRFNLPSFLGRWTFQYHRNIIAYYFLETSLWCLGKVVTWVLLTVYYYDCKKIVLLNSEDQATTSPVRIENITLLN